MYDRKIAIPSYRILINAFPSLCLIIISFFLSFVFHFFYAQFISYSLPIFGCLRVSIESIKLKSLSLDNFMAERS